MSLKYSYTTADAMDWNEAMNLIRNLTKDEKWKMSLLVAIGCFTGLRISDILALSWRQILDMDELVIIEKKTKKRRVIRLNKQLSKHITECYHRISPKLLSENILISQKGTVYTIQRINVILKEVRTKYKVSCKNFSCHSLRKTFGRQVYLMAGENAELAMVKLMELFNHSSVSITKKYLGIRQEELMEAYELLKF